MRKWTFCQDEWYRDNKDFITVSDIQEVCIWDVFFRESHITYTGSYFEYQ